MAFRVKLDESLSGMLASPLEARGYSVHTVRSQGWGGFKDAILWQHLAAESVYFITTDKGFGDVRRHPPGTHAGILLLRPDRESLLEYKQLLEVLLDKHHLSSLAGTITVVSPRGVRVRRKP